MINGKDFYLFDHVGGEKILKVLFVLFIGWLFYNQFIQEPTITGW